MGSGRPAPRATPDYAIGRSILYTPTRSDSDSVGRPRLFATPPMTGLERVLVLLDPIVPVFETARRAAWCGKIIARLTNLDEANLSPRAVKWRFQVPQQGEAALRMDYGASTYRTSWSSNPVGVRHRADLTAVGWFVAIGLSLTVLFCALGHAESISQALAFSG